MFARSHAHGKGLSTVHTAMTSAPPLVLLLGFLAVAALLGTVTQVHAYIDTSNIRLKSKANFEVYANIHQLMTDGNHAAVVAAVDAALESGLSDVCPEGIPVSSLSFMKGMALYGMGRIPPAQEAFAAAVMAGSSHSVLQIPRRGYPQLYVLMCSSSRQDSLVQFWGLVPL
jgi:hypothetical protein